MSSRSIMVCKIVLVISPSQDPTNTKPRAKAAKDESSMAKLVSLTIGKSNSETSSREEPAYARPSLNIISVSMINSHTITHKNNPTYPKMADCLTERLPVSKCSDNKAKAGSDSSRTPEFKIPIPSKAPALI